MRRLGWRAISAWVIRWHGPFDPDWYAAQLEHPLPGRTAAIMHYVVRGRAAGLSPAPLFEPSWYAPKDWRTRHADPFAALIRRGAAATATPHPLFDPEAWCARHPEAARHPGGPVAHFLATAGPDTPMPLDGTVSGAATDTDRLRWGQARTALQAALAGWRYDERRRRAPRVTTGFDHDAARRLVRRGATAVLPDPSLPESSRSGAVLVSVVLPVKDRREQVRAAVASVQAQTLRSWELLAVDDGSGDGTAEVLAELAAADPRIRVLASGPDGRSHGVCAARNAAAARARGRYVAWLDSDNRWTPDFLRTVIATMAGAGWRVGYAAAEISTAGGTRYRAFDPGDDPDQVLALLEVANHVDLNVLVVERALLDEVGGFDETLLRTVDYDLVWRLARREVPHYVGVVGVVYDAGDEAADRITVTERASWREVVKNRRLIDWAGLAGTAGGRVAGRTSVIVVAGDGWAAAWVSVSSVLRAAGPADDIEVVVVDDGGRRADAVLLSTLPLLDPRVRFQRTPVRGGRPLAGNLGLAASTGGIVLLLAAGTELWPDALGALRAGLDDPAVSAVAPLVLGRDGRLVAAGTVHGGDGGPAPALAGYNVEDARRRGACFDAVTAADEAVAVRAGDLIAAHGLDPLFVARGSVVDLCLRLPGRTVVATAAVTSHATRLRPGVALAQARTPVARPAGAADADERLLAERWPAPPALRGPAPGRDPGEVGLRWVIKTALPVGPDAVRWGDLHFARALAAALERLGQEVVIDHRPAMGLPGAVPEDVVLVLRGLEPPPGPGRTDPGSDRSGGGGVRMMWVISHPEAVTDGELRGQDRVFAASRVWAERVRQRAGVQVVPLLQCTDPGRFHPGAGPADGRDGGDRVLFVGNSRNVFRPVVRDLLAAGVDVAIYGDKWERFLGPGRVRGRFIPNERLAAAYASAGVVLNDHWDDMRAQGFYSNRLFDAAACGARIVSDRIDGLEDLFGGLARTFGDAAELVSLVRGIPGGFPDDARREELAKVVAAEHSFDARARALLGEALRLRGGPAAG